MKLNRIACFSGVVIISLSLISAPLLAADRQSPTVARKSEHSAHVPYIPAAKLKPFLDPKALSLQSAAAVVYDVRDGEVLYAQEADMQTPIASLTKLMTAVVVLERGSNLGETIQISEEDRDRLRNSGSRLKMGTKMTRGDALLMALVASDNRAAAALARTYPGGTEAFVRAMNAKAKKLGMARTRYADSTGLDAQNVSTAQDLVKLIGVAYKNPTIRKMSSTPKGSITDLRTGRKVEFFNTNGLVRQKSWDVNLSKTGYIAPAGHCLLMQVEIGGRPLIIVLLKSWGKYSRVGDANRIKKWLVNNEKRARRGSTIARS